MYRIAFCFLACGLLVGCGGGSGAGGDKLETYTVTGKVTLDGKPVEGASVAFGPAETGKGRTATGRTDSSGEYKLTTYESGDGAAAGDYVVTVSKYSDPGEESAEDAHAQMSEGGAPESHGGGGEPKSLLPEKYATKTTSDLKKTVEAKNGNVIDLELKP